MDMKVLKNLCGGLEEALAKSDKALDHIVYNERGGVYSDPDF